MNSPLEKSSGVVLCLPRWSPGLKCSLAVHRVERLETDLQIKKNMWMAELGGAKGARRGQSEGSRDRLHKLDGYKKHRDVAVTTVQ